jgi:hypothetical protein
VIEGEDIEKVNNIKILNLQQSLKVKIAKALFQTRKRSLPQLKFEDQSLTSYAGLVVFQKLFGDLDLDRRLKQAGGGSGARSLALVFKLMVIHSLIGLKRFRDGELCRDDPMVARLLGARSVPGTSSVSRALSAAGDDEVADFQRLGTDMVLERLATENFGTITLDFDGTVLSTKRRAQGTACGFNKKAKGRRSYYPLVCTLAQTGQVFDLVHRSGNVHDSNGAVEFMRACVGRVRRACPRARIEVRADSAFFSDATVTALEALGVEYSLSVPFERFPELKEFIGGRKAWRSVDRTDGTKGFQKKWKPKSWTRKARFIFVRSHNPRKRSEPLQLDLFQPREFGFDYKVVVSNKTGSMKSVASFHDGRGQQENLFAELKSEGTLGYIPARKWNANKLYLIAGMLAHNLNRELQMRTRPKQRSTSPGRSPMWIFQRMDTVRRNLIARAGRITRPQGNTTLTMSPNEAYKELIETYLNAA